MSVANELFVLTRNGRRTNLCFQKGSVRAAFHNLIADQQQSGCRTTVIRAVHSSARQQESVH